MDKTTPEYKKRLAEAQRELGNNPGVKRLVDLNVFTVEAIVDHTIRLEDMFHNMKTEIIPQSRIETLNKLPALMNTEQSVEAMLLTLNCVCSMDDYHKAVEKFIAPMSILLAVLDKCDELSDIKDAINA